MKDFLFKTSTQFYQDLCGKEKHENLQLIVIIHILPDILPILAALKSIVDIALIVVVPYSVHQPTLEYLNKRYRVITPSLEVMTNERDTFFHEILNNINVRKKTIIFEIGGYCAPIIKKLKKNFGNLLLGVIEDTEAGHRRYEQLAKVNLLPCPVISVARSLLKGPEDFIVGATCLHVVEKLIRTTGFPLHGRHSLVLGFGKIGRGVAHALRQYHSIVYVYDIDPIKNIQALSEGFQALDRKIALKQAEVVYGTTGCCSISKEDLSLLNNPVVLVSCSSKQVEFDVASLQALYHKHPIGDGVDLYQAKGKKIYLLADGKPVNFLNGSVTQGPLLNLPLGEMVFAIKKLFLANYPAKFNEITIQEKQVVATKWLKYFCNLETGRYKHGRVQAK
jgi:adenosylhomocysteinase